MLEESRLRQLSDSALAQAKGYETELIFSVGEGALTRFGDSVITQNVVQGEAGVSIRLMKDGKMGKASTGNLTEKGIASCVASAKATLEFSAPDSELLPLISPQTYQSKESYNPRTLAFSPEERADGVTRAVNRFQKDDCVGAGIFSTGAGAIAIANSKGVWAYHQKTSSSFSVSAFSKDSSGWAQVTDRDAYALDLDGTAETAARKAIASRAPHTVEPGEWTVVLEPAAVADAMMYLAWEGFNGKLLVEGRSPFSGKAGQKVVGDNITIVDDAYHALTPGQPFDYEGMPRQRVSLIENGVFIGGVHDRATGKMAGVPSTGHALPQPDTGGPLPVNLVISAGKSTLEEMIGSTERGLLVTRFHYTNILDPMKLTITGMTRDGLFLIEKGRVVRGVKNMRFTESILAMLNNVELISSDLYKTDTFWGGGGTVAPAMKVNKFHFTSATEN
jgi:predicted Zn-dependent protease